jgi:hypothetical protein
VKIFGDGDLVLCHIGSNVEGTRVAWACEFMIRLGPGIVYGGNYEAKVAV